MRYDFQPGRLGARRSSWPADTTLISSTSQVTVLAFLHPRCVCTAATVKLLVRTLHQHPDSRLITVVFRPPAPAPAAEWEDAEYVRTIRAEVPAACLVLDPGGAEARRLGVATSGTLLVYDRRGNEIFRGGITARRGGEDDNPALRQFAQALAEEARSGPDNPPVFGCSLQAPLPEVPMAGEGGETP
jgi:hypothetical protein